MRTKVLLGFLLWLALSLLLPAASPAAVVGHFTQVEGEVTLLKKGRLPAIHLKQNDGVEQGDVVRTKSLSKAQITFIDDTVLTIAPGSRIAIEKYMVDGGKRSAVLQMFRGVTLAVVSKIFKANAPDFVVKTNTAIMGVRGTKVGLRLYPNFSEILTFQGVTEVSNRFPEIPGLVQLKDGQGTRVTRGLPPTKQFKVGPQDLKQFMLQLTTGLSARVRDQDSKHGSSDSSNVARGSSGSGENILISIPSTLQPTAKEEPAPVVQVEETPPPPPPPSPPSSQNPYVVDWSSGGQYIMVKGEQSGETGPQAAIYTGTIPLVNGSQVNFSVVAVDPSPPGNFNQSSSGIITWRLSGSLDPTGPNSYSGMVTATGTTQGGTVFTFPLQAIYDDVNHKLTLTSVGPVSGGYVSTSTSGDFTLPSDPSHKITTGTASISWTLTPTVDTASTSTTTVSSAITQLPLPATLSTVGPPSLALSPPGQTAAASSVGTTVVTPSGVTAPGLQTLPPAALSPTVLTTTASPVMTPSGVTPPGLQNRPAALNNVPPGLVNAPGQGASPPGNAYGRSKN